MKSRKVKAAAKSKKSFLSNKKLKGNLPLETFSDSDADVDSNALLYDEKRDGRDNDLSTDDELIRHEDDSSEEEEVLPITDDEKEDSEDQKEEGEESEEDEERGLPSKEAWGSKKSTYYNADFVDEDRGRTYREEDAEKARAEAEEAYAMQMSVSSVAANYATEILQLHITKEPSKEESDEEINLDSLDIKQKLKYLKKKFPELLLYINEFKEKASELKDKIVPLLGLVNSGENISENFADYIKVKYQTLLHYCMNISFYMVLKSKGDAISNHPVLQRINSFKNILDRLNGNENFIREIDFVVSKLQRNEEVHFKNYELSNPTELEGKTENEYTLEDMSKISQTEPKSMKKTESKKRKKSKDKNTEAEKEIFSLYMDLQKLKKEKNPKTEVIKMDEDAIANDGTITEEKRTITYEIAKNKGLTAKRKKELRNPRVHNKMKFRKAQIRRKGQVKNVIREVTRYAGEPTGISSHVIRSRKLK